MFGEVAEHALGCSTVELMGHVGEVFLKFFFKT
jgi:hypothetical protein